jgi:hypothetical protein
LFLLQLWHWVVSEVSMREERFGTHHSKIILAFYSTGIYIYIDPVLKAYLLSFERRYNWNQPTITTDREYNASLS